MTNRWFIGLEKGKQEVLLEDKWMLANAAFLAGKEQASKEIAEAFDSDEMITAEDAIDAIKI